MSENGIVADINEINVDIKIRDAVERCLAFLDSTAWVGRGYRVACGIDELERDLHRTLARTLGDELSHRIDRLKAVGLDFDSHYRPFQNPDHEINQTALPMLCREISRTEVTVAEIADLVRRMTDRNLYPELRLDRELDYVEKLQAILRETHTILNCCEEYYEELAHTTYSLEDFHLPRPQLHPRLRLYRRLVKDRSSAREPADTTGV